MATPSAVLSVLVSADTADATAKLSKFDRQIAATTDVARKGIEARLGGTFNPEAFTKYEAALKRASTAAKDRAAFKAELGANFNNKGFLAYQRGVDQANKSTKEASKHTDGLSRSVKGLTTSLLAAGGAFAAFEVAKEAITSTLELGHATERLSAVTGLGVKQASTWIETMKVRGVQTKAVGMAFITLSRNVRTAQDADTAHVAKIKSLVASQKVERASLEATGASHKQLAALEVRQQLALDKLSGPSTSKAVAAFAELGVSQDTLKSKNTEKILLAVADGMSKVEDPSRRAALAQQIFGRGAQGLIPILAQGKKGVEDALGAAQKYGAYLPQNAKQLKGTVDAQHNLNLAMDGLKISFTTAVLPSLVQGAGLLLKFIGQMRDGKGAGGQFADALKTGFAIVKTVVGDVVSAFGGLKSTLLILGGLWATSKVVSFGKALQGLADVAKGPVAKGLEGQASGGILSGLRAGVARGLAIGGIGSTLSAGIGNAIGGGTGDAIKKIGTDASVGAGIGAIFGPEGAVGGALIGGLVGSLHHFVVNDVVKEGQAFADKFTAPLGPAVAKQFHGALAKGFEKTADAQQLQKFRQQEATHPGLARGGPGGGGLPALSEADIQKQFFDRGRVAGQATIAGLKSVKDPSATTLLTDFQSQLAKLGPRIRPEAAKTMVDFAIGLQQSGKLPYDALQGIMKNLEKQVPGLSAYLQNQGQSINQIFTKTLLLSPATATLKRTLAGYRQQFGDWEISTKITGQNIDDNMSTAMNNLRTIIANSSGKTRRDAVGEYTKLHDQVIDVFHSMGDKVNTSIKSMSTAIKNGSESAAKVAATNLGSFVTNVETAMHNGVISVGRGMSLIISETNQALKEMGQKQLTPIQVGSMTLTIGKQQQLAGHATGGLVTQPGYFAGEEAPRHPEVILATNPAYRQRNLGLFAQAGHMLGVPGFATGGISATVTAPSVTGGGSMKTIVHAAIDKIAAAANSYIGKQTSGISAGAFAGQGGTSPANAKLGHAMMLAAGWPESQWPSLDALWTQESGWSAYAVNSGSGAYGIPQALGHGHPFNLGDAPSQIAWGLNYIRGRYGSPAAAEAHERANNWYRQGGIFGGIPGFAQGGFVADPGTNFSVGAEPTIVARLTALAQSIGAIIYGISGYRTPQHSVAVGGSANDPHTRGQAADIGVNSQLRASAAQLSAAQLSKFGLDRPFDESGAPGNTEVNHIQLLPGWVAQKGSTIAAAAKGVAKKAKKFKPSPVPKLSLPRNLANVPSGATPTITALVGKLNNIIDPNLGTASALSDRISATSGIYDQRISEYQAKNPNTDTSTGLIASTDPATGATSHTIDQAFVSMRVAELQQLIAWQAQLRNQLKDSVRRIVDLLGKLAVQIATRRAYIKKVRSQILGNIAVIDALTKYEKTPKLTRRQKSDIAAEVTALKNQNTQLGGNPMKIGSAGILGKVSGEIDSMNQTIDTMQSNRVAIAGASGIGGTLGAANLDLQSFADQLSVFSPAATQAALATATAGDIASAASAGGGAAATPTGPDPALLQQLLDQAHLATSVAEQQLSVLQATPPFGGSFAQGGIVPGPLGAPRTIIAHAGEAVGTPGDTHVHVHLASGMEWLREFVSIEVQNGTRGQSVGAMRIAGLPGSRGGP